MTPIELFRLLALAFLLGSGDDGRVGCNAPPAQATECWIGAPGEMAGAWVTVDGVRYVATEADDGNSAD